MLKAGSQLTIGRDFVLIAKNWYRESMRFEVSRPKSEPNESHVYYRNQYA
jgi:hypothetical protein